MEDTPDMQFLAEMLIKVSEAFTYQVLSDEEDYRLRAIRDEKVGLGYAPSPYNHYSLPWRLNEVQGAK